MWRNRCCSAWENRRPSVYKRFVREYEKMNERLGMKQYLVPYLMSSHPGSTLKEAVELAEYLRDIRLYAGTGAGFLSHPVHRFLPACIIPVWIPGTWSRCMCR